MTTAMSNTDLEQAAGALSQAYYAEQQALAAAKKNEERAWEASAVRWNVEADRDWLDKNGRDAAKAVYDHAAENARTTNLDRSDGALGPNATHQLDDLGKMLRRKFGDIDYERHILNGPVDFAKHYLNYQRLARTGRDLAKSDGADFLSEAAATALVTAPGDRGVLLRFVEEFSRELKTSRSKGFLGKTAEGWSRGFRLIKQDVDDFANVMLKGKGDEQAFSKQIIAARARGDALIDPDEDPWYEQGAVGAGMMAPTMAMAIGTAGLSMGTRAATIVATKGRAALTVAQKARAIAGNAAAWTMPIFSDRYAEYRHAGLTDTQAKVAGGISAVIEATIEGLEINPFTRGLTKPMATNIRKWAREFARDKAIQFGVELSEESFQAVTGEGIKAIATRLSEEAPDSDLSEIWKQAGSQTVDAFWPLVFLVAPGGAFEGVSGAKGAARMEAFGETMATKEGVIQWGVQNPEAAQALLEGKTSSRRQFNMPIAPRSKVRLSEVLTSHEQRLYVKNTLTEFADEMERLEKAAREGPVSTEQSEQTQDDSEPEQAPPVAEEPPTAPEPEPEIEPEPEPEPESPPEAPPALQTYAGQTFTHWTSPEAQVELESGKPFDRAKAPQHVQLEGLSNEPAEQQGLAGRRIYLSLQDERWRVVTKPTGKGEPVEYAELTQEQKDSPTTLTYFDYKTQKWMVIPGGQKQVELAPVGVRLKPEARVLEIGDPDRASMFGLLGKDKDALEAVFDALAEQYDAVAIINTDQYGADESVPGHQFFRQAGGDQIIVLNEDMVEIVTKKRPVKKKPEPEPEPETEQPPAEPEPEPEKDTGPEMPDPEKLARTTHHINQLKPIKSMGWDTDSSITTDTIYTDTKAIIRREYVVGKAKHKALSRSTVQPADDIDEKMAAAWARAIKAVEEAGVEAELESLGYVENPIEKDRDGTPMVAVFVRPNGEQVLASAHRINYISAAIGKYDYVAKGLDESNPFVLYKDSKPVAILMPLKPEFTLDAEIARRIVAKGPAKKPKIPKQPQVETPPLRKQTLKDAEATGADLDKLRRRGEQPADHEPVMLPAPNSDRPTVPDLLKQFLNTVPEFALDPHFVWDAEGEYLTFSDGGVYAFIPEALGFEITGALENGARIKIDVEQVADADRRKSSDDHPTYKIEGKTEPEKPKKKGPTKAEPEAEKQEGFAFGGDDAATPRKTFTLSARAIAHAFPGARVAMASSTHGVLTLPNGTTIDIRWEQDIEPDIEEVRKLYGDEIADNPDVIVPGRFIFTSGEADITSTQRILQLLAGEADEATLAHESLHIARQLGLFTEGEWQMLAEEYAPGIDLKNEVEIEEAIADAAEKWSDTLAKQIWDFLVKIANVFQPTARGAMRSLRTNEKFWRRLGKPTTGAGAVTQLRIRKSPEQLVSEHQIIRTMERLFDTPIRIGRISQKHFAGIFKSPWHVARLKRMYGGDLGVAIHEIAHAISRKFNAPYFEEEQVQAPGWTELQAMDYEPKNRVEEGWAEFLRMYLWPTGKEDVLELAPDFHKYFVGTWLPANPELAAKITEIEVLLVQRKAMTAEQQVGVNLLNLTDDPHTAISPLSVMLREAAGTALDRWYAKWKDALHYTKLFDDAIRKRGLDVEPGDSIHDLAIAGSMAAPSYAENAIRNGVFGVTRTGFMEKIGKGLHEHLRPVKPHEYDHWMKWVWARHSLEMWDNNMHPGMDRDQAKEIYEAGKHNTHWLEAAEGLTQFNKDLITMLEGAGVLSAESGAKILSSYKTYIPLFRVKKGGKLFGFGKKGLKPPSAVVHRRWGSAEPIIDPVQATIRQALFFYQAALNQQIMQELYNQARATPGMGAWVEEVPPGIAMTKFNFDEIWEKLEDMDVLNWEAKNTRTKKAIRALELDEIEGLARHFGMDISIISRAIQEEWLESHDGDIPAKTFDRKYKAVLVNGIYDATREWALTQLAIFRPDYKPDPVNRITRLNINGKPVMVQFHEELYRLVEGMDYKQFDSRALRIVAEATKFLKLGATGLSFRFALRNLARDFPTFLIQSKAKGVKETANLFASPWAMMAAFAVYGEDNIYVKLWEDLGGSMAQVLGTDRRHLIHAAQDAIHDRSKRSLYGIVRDPIDTARSLINISEVGPRLAEFKMILARHGWTQERLMAEGMPPRRVLIEAINASNDVTLNFKRMGWRGKQYNQIIPFFNAAIEGLDKYGRTWRDQPMRTMLRGSVMIALTIPYWFKRKDDDDYKDMAPWLKYGFWTISDDNGNTVVRIPRPFEWGWTLSAGVEALLNQLYDKDPDALMKWGKEMFTALRPSINPGLIGPTIEATMNYSFYRGAPIYSKLLKKHQLPQYQYKPYTLETTKAITRWLASVTPYGVTFPTAQLEYWMNQVSGGMYNRLVGTGENLLLQNREWQGADIPGVGGFLLRRNFPESIGQFYGDAEKVEQTHGSAEDNGFMTHELEMRQRQAAVVRGMMGDVRKLIPERTARAPRDAINKYRVGLARWYLGLENLVSTPNLMAAKPMDLPEDIRAIRTKYLKRWAGEASKNPPTTKVKDYAASYKRWKLTTEHSLRMIQRTGIDPIEVWNRRMISQRRYNMMMSRMRRLAPLSETEPVPLTKSIKVPDATLEKKGPAPVEPTLSDYLLGSPSQ